MVLYEKLEALVNKGHQGKYLIKMKANWADEYDIHGQVVVDGEVLQMLLDYYFWCFVDEEFWFNVNQLLTFRCVEDFVDTLWIKTITDGKAKDIESNPKKQTRTHGYGGIIHEVLERIADKGSIYKDEDDEQEGA